MPFSQPASPHHLFGASTVQTFVAAEMTDSPCPVGRGTQTVGGRTVAWHDRGKSQCALKVWENPYLIFSSTKRVNVRGVSYRGFSVWASKQLCGLGNLTVAPILHRRELWLKDFQAGEELKSSALTSGSVLCPEPHSLCCLWLPKSFPTKSISYYNIVLFLVTSRNLDVLNIKDFIHFFGQEMMTSLD